MSGILGSGDFAKSFSAVQMAAARPTFELGFAMLQNALLDQLDVKIEAVQNQNVNRVDEFLALESKRLERSLKNVNKFGTETQHNADVLNESLTLLDQLKTADSNLDEEGFNAIKTNLDDLMKDSILNVQGSAAGFNVKDGFYDNYSENGSGLSDFADYATAGDRTDAVADVINNILRISTVMEINRDTAFDLSNDIQSRLTAINLQVTAEQTANQTEAIQEIEKLQSDYANFLSYLSLSFEVSQNAAQQLADGIQQNNNQQGTVVDIIS